MAGGSLPGSTPMRNGRPYFVGSDNATRKVTHHQRARSHRAPFLRYFKFNLPRTTKVLLLLVVAGIGACAFAVSKGGYLPFPGADLALWLVTGFAAVFVVVGAVTKLRIWDFGLVAALGSVLVYVVGVTSETSPYVWNGAPTGLAATYTLMLLLAAGYVVLYWALNYGMIVAYPDSQNFHD